METFHDFVRDCYLQSEPSVDIDKVTADNPINCCKHKLSVNIAEKLINELIEAMSGSLDAGEVRTACNMWLLSSGPQLIN